MDFRNELIIAIKQGLKVDVSNLLEVPPNPEMGNFALPCFSFAAKEKKAPNQIAQEYVGKIIPPKFIDKIESQGPYINFFIKKGVYAKEILTGIKENYGKGTKKEKIMVEYSAPNILKAFHIGHVRNTSIGESLSRILKYSGNKVIQANYINDKGAHIGKWIWMYNKKHKGEQPKGNVERWMADIYAEAYKTVEKSKKAQEEVAKLNKELISGKGPQALWQRGRNWSMKGFEEIYKALDANFDVVFWESPLDKRASKIVDSLLKKKIAKESEGAIILDYENYNLGITVIRRKDGTNLYLTSDFALAEEKFKKYKMDRSIYVVGSEQKLHFKQLFKTLELNGYKNANKLQHLSYELVRFPGKKMSSRTGDNKLFIEFKEEVEALTFKEVDVRHPGWTKKKKDETASAIALAAIKFGMIKQDPNKIVTFDPDKEISFEGETGPYLQYTHARACSILKKAKLGKAKLEILDSAEEFEIINAMSEFPSIIQKSGEQLKPSLLANYLLELAKKFNSFYQKHYVIQDDKELQNARLVLVDKVRLITAKGLFLLGLKAPEEM